MSAIGLVGALRDEATKLSATLFRRRSADEVLARMAFAELDPERPGLLAVGHRA